VAEPTPSPVPPVPDNPFAGGGTEKNIDQQNALLNDLTANQGQAGRQIYARQDPRAQALLQQRLAAAGTVPDARKAVYDAFSLDAKSADKQQLNTMQRQAQLGDIFMKQARAAVPIYAKNVDATTEAMRLQFEERRRREQEQADLQRQQIRASMANAAASRSANKTPDELLADQIQKKDIDTARNRSILERSGKPKTQWPATAVAESGLAGARLDNFEAARKLGLGTTSPALRDLGDKAQNRPSASDALKLGQQTVDAMWVESDPTFDQTKVSLDALVSLGFMSRNQAAIILTANAPRWGMQPDEWLADAQRYMRGR
jgi:hypothetical protein